MLTIGKLFKMHIGWLSELVTEFFNKLQSTLKDMNEQELLKPTMILLIRRRKQSQPNSFIKSEISLLNMDHQRTDQHGTHLSYMIRSTKN